jgi:hypothetical protein
MSTALAPRPTPPPTEMMQRLAIGKGNYRTEKEQFEVVELLIQQLSVRRESSPFRFLQDRNGSIQPYLTASGAADIMAQSGATVTDIQISMLEGCAIARCTISMKDGRIGCGMGAVYVAGLKGEQMANGLMKASTKATRRTILQHCRPEAVWLLQEDDLPTIEGIKTLPIETTAIPQTELPESGATAPAKRGVAPSARKSEPSASDSGKSASTSTTKEVVILDTQYLTEPVPHYVITVRESEPQPFEPAVEHILLTANEALFDRATKAMGSGEMFAATWHNSRRPNGDIGKTLDDLVAA